MPRAPVTWNELGQMPIAAHQEMRRYPQPAQCLEVWMRRTIQRVSEKMFNGVACELTRRQADAMNHQSIHRGIAPRVLVRGRNLARAGKNTARQPASIARRVNAQETSRRSIR